jgi:hypothetical protein
MIRLPPHPPPSVSSTVDTQKGYDGVEEEPNHTMARKLALYKSFNILCYIFYTTNYYKKKTSATPHSFKY